MMDIEVRGRQFRVDPGRNAAFWQQVASGQWESATFAVFERFLDPAHTYLDIGCWIGPTLLYGCQLAARAYAVEPDPIAFEELQRNVALNRPTSDRVQLANLCIARKSGEVAFGSRGAGGDSTSSLLFGKKRTHWTVKALSFADFIREYGIAECNFIKMDIEGGEYLVLPGMRDYLHTHRPTLHLSLHPCYLKLRPLGLPGRWLARLLGTWRILRCTRFYRYRYDQQGRPVSAARLLWLCRAKISLDIVLTDRPWPQVPSGYELPQVVQQPDRAAGGEPLPAKEPQSTGAVHPRDGD
jgi:FkbM family methyltransferase